jgi:hypothetical protein
VQSSQDLLTDPLTDPYRPYAAPSAACRPKVRAGMPSTRAASASPMERRLSSGHDSNSSCLIVATQVLFNRAEVIELTIQRMLSIPLSLVQARLS